MTQWSAHNREVQVHKLGCAQVCTTGKQIAIEAVLTNPGTEAVAVELRPAVQFPNGSFLGLPVHEMLLPPGETTVPLASFLVPDVPAGSYQFQGALLHSVIGATLAVDRLRVEKGD